MVLENPNDNTNVNNNSQVDETQNVNDNQNDPGTEPGSIESMVDDLLANETRTQPGQQQQQQQRQPNNRQPGQQQQQRQPTNPQQTQQTQQRGNQPIRTIPGAFLNAQGDVVDWQGRPLASRGVERRLFEQAHGPMKGILERLQQAEQQVEVFNRAHNITKDGGLTPAEVLMGHQLAAAWKKDPGKTLQFMLQQAREQGINVEGIGSTNAIDIPAIGALVEQKFAKMLERFEPVFKEWETHRQQTELDSRVDSDVNQFFSDYPDAKVQEAAIAEIMTASNYTLSMHQAYTLALRYAHEKGLDWTKPLVDQVNGSAPNANRREPPTNRRELPPMGGGGNSNAHRGKKSSTVGANSSFEEIFNETLDELGLRAT